MSTLTRQELYDLVWSTPMIKLADQFGLSDVGLTKICDRHRVPTPPRGYWAKKDAGKPVKQTIFVQVDDPFLDRIQIASSRDRLPEPVREIVERRRAERKQALYPQQTTTMKPAPMGEVSEPHPAVRATAKMLRGAKSSKTGIAQAVGAGLCGISVGTDNVERIIFILDQLARACEVRGLLFVPADTRLSVSVGKDEVTFEIKEKTKQVPHVLTETEIAAEEKRRKRLERQSYGRGSSWDDIEMFSPGPPKFDAVRTGELGLEVHGWGDGLRRSWRDGKTQTLETMVDEIVDGLEAHIVAGKHRREAREREEAERQELARRHSLAKARRERESNRKSLLSKLIRTERQVAQLREWISTYERHPKEGSHPDLDRMLSWARDRLSVLEATLDPSKLQSELNTRKLFPEVDELHDPLGEPPPERRWW
jgi:hypothetical protein